jgi:4-hydroxybenzoate polyprenyltransferase
MTRGGGGGPGSAAVREGQTFHGPSLIARYASLVRLPHTLFALPFAGVGVILASAARPSGISVATVLWVVIAFTAGRFAAMGFNRIVDRRLDALNPRTRLRELPAGRLSVLQAAVSVVVSAVIFVTAAWELNPLCGWLSPLALAWVFFYSYTKRFTALSHAVLGYSLGIAPVGAYLAVTGAWSRPWYALVVVASGVMFWVAGFDVIYALQDEGFDQQHGLHALPARLGPRGALRAARLLHGLAVLLFAAVWVFHWFGVRWLYAAAVAFMAAALHYEHSHVRDAAAGQIDVRRIDRAFFLANVVVSTTFFALTLVDRLI